MAVVVGVVLKSAFPEAATGGMVVETCRVLGELFMRGLKMIIVPIVFTSIVCGIGGVGAMKGFGRLGLKTVLFYGFTTLLAATVGLLMVNAIQPGLQDGQPNPVVKAAIEAEAGKLKGDAKAEAVASKVEEQQSGVGATLRDLVVRMVPTNVVESAAATDMLGLITFALFFGIAMASLEGPAIESVRQLFQGLNAITLKITDWIMACAPIGVFALVTPVVAATGGGIFQALGWYFVTVLAGLGIHMFVTMPILLMVLGRINPRKHFAAMRDAILTADPSLKETLDKVRPPRPPE